MEPPLVQRAAGSDMGEQARVHHWRRFEVALEVEAVGQLDPLRDAQVEGVFVGPSGRECRAPGFWDGGGTWRLRFAPDEVGHWRYSMLASVTQLGQPWRPLAESRGEFECVPYAGENPLYRHGPPRMSANRRHLVHADGTPFFWLADTVWNGPILSTPDEWEHYVRTRREQGFTTAQFVSTQWRTAPDGGPDGPSHAGDGRLERVCPRFFRRLDVRFDALADAGIAGAPVLLWAIGGGENAYANPGHVLPEEDAILLARYQVARWHAHPVVWILNGDGRYTGQHAARWQRIGRGVFLADQGRTSSGERQTQSVRPSSVRRTSEGPVATHPGGRQWVGAEFKSEAWLDMVGYQSGHRGTAEAWGWLAGMAGDSPARRWAEVPNQAVINLEPCYENHRYRGEGTDGRFDDADVRRACYWSLLATPTAGVTYGGHGIWGWDDGTGPPVAHLHTGIPLPWQRALQMPGARQMRYLSDFFHSIAWWTLRPDQELLREQPGNKQILRFVAAARDDAGRQAVLYLPAGGALRLDAGRLALPLRATWFNPRVGSRVTGPRVADADASLSAPDANDWLLLLAPDADR